MDPDAEFNSLTGLYQSVVHDMKQTYPGWETVSLKAIKLASQIKVTAQYLCSFVDAIQSVSDHANNLKGASRDVGACVTRVCIRERALESRLRAWADALSDEMAVSLQQRAAYWKSRTSELDKAASKHVKKVRSRKHRPDPNAMNEQRALCTQILAEQRAQFAFFTGTLMPVLNAQIGALDEGSHIRQVVESLDSTVKHVDTEKLISTIVSDVCQGADSAWRECLAAAGQKASEEIYSIGSIRDLSAFNTPTLISRDDHSDTFSRVSGDFKDRYIQENRERRYRSPLNSSFIPPEPSCKDVGESCALNGFGKPPLQRRTSERSLGTASISSQNDSSYSTVLNNVSEERQRMFQSNLPPPYHHVIQQRSTEQINGRNAIQRPQSFGGALRVNYTTPSSCLGSTPIFTNPMSNSSCSSSDAASSSALLIAETVHQIDQLGSDLENYCAMSDSRLQRQPSLSNVSRSDGSRTVEDFSGPRNNFNIPSQQGNNLGTVRIRTASSGSSRPPPPTRRSSQITAATPTAPSVAETRLSANSIMGSRQSLNSTALYSQNGSTLDLYMSAAPNRADNYRI
ncbi:unnamed protein product [Caenorhabditis auriculariae]|uniref:IMD domain-containing protein n=1 Tax=Caenorhabditis auriculariae TaxID=2777116 RepID=A0A8S1HFR8_9PELO|nr:unnamed protein product [Caenorhabditis auriculariae]